MNCLYACAYALQILVHNLGNRCGKCMTSLCFHDHYHPVAVIDTCTVMTIWIVLITMTRLANRSQMTKYKNHDLLVKYNAMDILAGSWVFYFTQGRINLNSSILEETLKFWRSLLFRDCDWQRMTWLNVAVWQILTCQKGALWLVHLKSLEHNFITNAICSV